MFPSSSTLALIHMTELEFTSPIKTKVSVSMKIRTDRGNKTMLERNIYIGNVQSRMKVIRSFDLFRVQGTNMAKYAPRLNIACQYICFDNQ